MKIILMKRMIILMKSFENYLIRARYLILTKYSIQKSVVPGHLPHSSFLLCHSTINCDSLINTHKMSRFQISSPIASELEWLETNISLLTTQFAVQIVIKSLATKPEYPFSLQSLRHTYIHAHIPKEANIQRRESVCVCGGGRGGAVTPNSITAIRKSQNDSIIYWKRINFRASQFKLSSAPFTRCTVLF